MSIDKLSEVEIIDIWERRYDNPLMCIILELLEQTSQRELKNILAIDTFDAFNLQKGKVTGLAKATQLLSLSTETVVKRLRDEQ